MFSDKPAISESFKAAVRMITESSTEQATFAKHARGYIKHANKAAECEEDHSRRDDTETHWESSRHHMNEIGKKFGTAGQEYVSSHVHTHNDDFEDHYHRMKQR